MNDDLVSLIIQNYPLIEVKVLERLKTEVVREAYKISSGDQTFVVKISSTDKDSEQIKKDTEILLFLNSHQLTSPKLLKTNNGLNYLRTNNKYLYIYEFIEGEHPSPSNNFFQKLGILLAKLHSLPTSEYPHQSNFTPEVELPRIKQNLLKIDKPDQQPWVKEIVEEIDNFPNFDDLPKAIIHTDPYFFNLLEDDKGQLCLIDLDDAGIAPAIIDVGYVLAHMCVMSVKDREKYQVEGIRDENGISYNPDWAEAFLNSYQQIRPLDDQEKRLLPHAAIFAMVVYIEDGEDNRINQNNFNRYQKIKEVLLGN